MSNNLIFIMSDSESYLRDETIRIYEKWGFNSSAVKHTEEWNSALVRESVSLFGDVSMIHLDLSDKNKLKKFADLTTNKKTKDLFKGENWFGPGLIITSTHARGAKRVENLVNNSGGQVVKKEKPAEMVNILMKRINLNEESNNFLRSYVGEDFQILVGIVNQIEELSEEEQRNITVDDLIVRLPSKPGSVLPWEFVNPMLEGKTNEAVKLYKRAVEGSHVLVTLQLAKNKLQLLYRLKLLLMEGIWKSQEQAKILKERNGPNIWLTANVAKKIDVEVAEYLTKLAVITEAQLKGHSSADPDIIFINFITATTLAIKHNRALPLKMR